MFFKGFFKIAFASCDRWLQLDRPDYDFCKSILFWFFYGYSLLRGAFLWFLKMFHVESFKGGLGVFRGIGWNIVRNGTILRKQIPIWGVNSLNFFECSFVNRSEFFSEALGFKKRNVSYGTFLWYIFRKSLFHVENLSTKFKVRFISVAGPDYFQWVFCFSIDLSPFCNFYMQ